MSGQVYGGGVPFGRSRSTCQSFRYISVRAAARSPSDRIRVRCSAKRCMGTSHGRSSSATASAGPGCARVGLRQWVTGTRVSSPPTCRTTAPISTRPSSSSQPPRLAASKIGHPSHTVGPKTHGRLGTRWSKKKLSQDGLLTGAVAQTGAAAGLAAHAHRSRVTASQSAPRGGPAPSFAAAAAIHFKGHALDTRPPQTSILESLFAGPTASPASVERDQKQGHGDPQFLDQDSNDTCTSKVWYGYPGNF
mmetsp:Transcript_26969/g.80839  ORF Transcript_26969/g.80839 Transcript_26969/m.80839 type:complete len:249 (+) Transcript_26969:580-1326(+)